MAETQRNLDALTLSLESGFAGAVNLTARTGDGTIWNVIAITAAGRLFRHPGIRANIGFDVDPQGRVKLEG